MTILKLEYLSRQGEPDIGECSIVVDKTTYDELPVMPDKSFEGYVIKKGYFYEVYRGASENSKSKHKAVVLFNPNNKEEVSDDTDLIDNQTYWYFVWVEDEGVWIVFNYRDLDTISESYNSTVKTSFPSHGTIYKPNDKVFEIIKRIYPE